ncbi:ejaculatory bulb-specific protein 3-like [Hyposmocoma kahamanoa]|uniref:ejaculatory bulb-specific protein 3-like n=1 Tax=Hyposmocoma kahamanoa TaxID=1477025 RepID=UPI000E6D6BE0|nr:ejaculatory bulb-specific protein 3-like [Hyposmocoma kahamanoa]
MKTIIVCILALVAIVAARPDTTYTDRYDNINIDEILNNKRLLTPYIKCMLDQGKCSAEGKELKSHIKEALETYCEKCNDTQKTKTRQVISHLVNNENEYWNQLTEKYDPDHKYTKKYEDELRKIKA